MKGKGAGWASLVIGVSIGILLSVIIPSGAVIFILSLIILLLGCCLLKH